MALSARGTNQLPSLTSGLYSKAMLQQPPMPAAQAASAAAAYDVARARSVSTDRSSSVSSNGSSNASSGRGGQGAHISIPARDNVDPRSPRLDYAHRADPFRASELGQDVVDTLLAREQVPLCNPQYLANQPEVHEKMRTILVDWFVDVALKFKLHPETYFLAVNVVDRYLSEATVARTQLQLVGITAIWVAAKYEEMWAPTVQECVSITANTYSRDEVLRMERTVLAALKFKLTVPTCYSLMARLLDVMDADQTMRHCAHFFLEHAVLDYKHLNFLPSQLANASLYLAHLMLRKQDAWPFVLQHYSKAQLADFRECARSLLDFSVLIASSKYQSIRRKYSSSRFSEISRLPFPEQVE